MLRSEVNHRVLPLFTFTDAALILIASVIGAAFFNALFWTHFRSVTIRYHRLPGREDWPFINVSQDVAASYPYVYGTGGLLFGVLTLVLCVLYRARRLRRDAHLFADGLTARVENQWQEERTRAEKQRIEQAASYLRRNAENRQRAQEEMATYMAGVHQLEMQIVRAFPAFLARHDPDNLNSKEANEQAFRRELLSRSSAVRDIGRLRYSQDTEVLRLVGGHTALPAPLAKVAAPIELPVPEQLKPYL